METSYFYFFVLPLGIFVVILASLVFYYARREESAQKKLKKLMHAYVRKRVQQKEMLNKELERLKQLFQNNSIDEVTYQRFKQALENDYEKKREEAAEEINSVTAKKVPHVNEPVEITELDT